MFFSVDLLPGGRFVTSAAIESAASRLPKTAEPAVGIGATRALSTLQLAAGRARVSRVRHTRP